MPTLAVYRDTAAQLDSLGNLYIAGTATSGSGAGVLEDTVRLKSTVNQNKLYQHWHILRPDAAATEDKTAVAARYVASTGKITPSRTYTNAIANGEAYRLYGLIEPYYEMRAMINRVLQHPECKVLVDVTFQASDADNTRHSLASAAAWLTDPDWVYDVGHLTSTESRNEVDPYRTSRLKSGKAVRYGGVTYLEGFSHNVDDTLYVRCARPAYSFCRATGGTFGDVTTGLPATDTHEAAVDEFWVAWGVAMLYWQQRLHAEPENKAVQTEAARALLNWRTLCRKEFRPPVRSFRQGTSWGPASMRGGGQPLGLAR